MNQNEKLPPRQVFFFKFLEAQQQLTFLQKHLFRKGSNKYSHKSYVNNASVQQNRNTFT